MQYNLTSERDRLEEPRAVYIVIYPAGERCHLSHPYYTEITSNTLKTKLA